MYGAILGDIIGSPYEFDRGKKTKVFPLFSERSEYTDDTVMTIAVAEAFMDTLGQDEETILWQRLRNAGILRRMAVRYPGGNAENGPPVCQRHA